MLYRMWIRALALAAVTLILAPFVYPTSSVAGGILVAIAGVSSAWAFATGVLSRLKPRDRYDLGELRRVHDEEELNALHEDATGESVVCPRCFTQYPARVGACPRCGASG